LPNKQQLNCTIAQGNWFLNDNIDNNKINLHHLQNGYYTYAIYNKEGLLKTGMVLKWQLI